MASVKTLMLAAALALPVSAVYVATADVSVQAAGKMGKKAKKKAAKKVAYKSCGTYKYWKAGKCLDARAKK
ncbi:MAG: hypothetical protein AB7O57_05970 [Hyphomicrobiaceae bacterium]